MSSTVPAQAIPDRLKSPLRRLFGSWEFLLLGVAVVIFFLNVQASPYFLDPWNLSDATFNFTEKAMIAFAMALVIISGEIDLSVASIITLVSTCMGFAVQLGFDTYALVLVAISVGALCGAFNGFLVAGLGLPSGDQAYSGYPDSFAYFGQGYVWWVITFEMVLFAVIAVIFYVLLHKTSFGRSTIAIGNNPTAALFAGIRVARVKFILFVLTGILSAVAAVCLTSRLGSTRPSIAFGWELEIVTMVVLGGVNILGGSGTIPGVVIAAFVMGMVTFGLGLLNVPGIVMSIFVGLLLIMVIALPIVIKRTRQRVVG